MSQCPICNAAIWIGQRYCSTCDSYLPNPEEEDHFCPQCGIRVAPQQEICHKCKASLQEIAGTPSRAPVRAWRLLSRVLGIFIVTGLVIMVLLLVFLFNKSPGPPRLMVTPPPQAASEQTPAATPIPTAETAPSAPTAPAAQKPAAPPTPATPSPPEMTTPTPSPPMYFVNVHSLALRDGPTMSAPQIATLNFKDEVELLDTSGGWGRVRDVRRNIIGWSYMHYLQPVAALGPRAVP
jgi:predicted nucleic acid-binding Zn ribbon protein